MTISKNFVVPAFAKLLELPSGPNPILFVGFISSDDPITKQPWCPDVRAALPILNAAFSRATAPEVAFVEVGQRPEWKDPANLYRTNWNIQDVPTLARYELVSGEVKETGRIVEEEILDEAKFNRFIGIIKDE